MRLDFGRILLVAATVLAGGILLLPDEPRIQGKRISGWIRDLQGAGAEKRHTAEVVLRSLGTNALPALKLKLHSQDSAFKVAFLRLVWRQDKVKVRILPAKGWHLRAALGCQVLGPDALPLIPDLLQMATTDFISFEAAVLALSHMGTRGVPPLVKALEDSNVRVRQAAARALGAIGPEAKEAIPMLLKCLHDSDTRVRGETSLALGSIGISSPEVVEALAQALLDPNPEVRDNAVDALGQFGKHAKNVVPALLRVLSDPDEGVRADATNAFEAIQTDSTATEADPQSH